MESIKLRLAKLANKADAKELKPLLDQILTTLTALHAILGGVLSGSVTWDAASIADGDEEAKDVTVTGAALGDFVLVSASIDVADLALVAQVTAADTVTCNLLNNTGGAIDLASMTVYVRVIPRTALAALAALGIAS
jgi:predicted nuclease of predicted toxin-antitoxin system